MAIDLLSRDVGVVSIKAMQVLLSGPITNIVETKSGELEAALLRLNELVETLAQAKGENLQEEKDKQKEYVDQAMDISRPQPTDNSAVSKQTFGTTQASNLLKKDPVKKDLCICISRLTLRARKDIAKAIRMAGCCGPAANQALQSALATGTTNLAQQANQAAVGQQANNAAAPGVGPMGTPNAPGNAANAGNAGGSGGAGGGGNVGAGAAGATPPFGKYGMPALAFLGIAESMSKQMANVLNIGFYDNVLKGLLTESNNFRENLRQIVHQTQGFGDANREVEKSYKDVDELMSVTGMRRGRNQEIWLRNLERGLKYEESYGDFLVKDVADIAKMNKMLSVRVNKQKSVQGNALNAATMLNMNADNLNEVFMDWHMHLGMSVNDINNMGRGMQQIARDTGVTGSQLEKAVKSSEAIMKSMREAGIATSQAGANVIKMTALMQKYGVSDKGAQLMNALSSRSAFLDAPDQDRGYIARIASYGENQMGMKGLISQSQNGTILQSPELTSKFYEAKQAEFKNYLQGYAPNFKELGIDLKDFDMSKLTDLTKQLSSKGIYSGKDPNLIRQADSANRLLGTITDLARRRGQSVGDMAAEDKVIKESKKTPQERLAEIQNKVDILGAKGVKRGDEFKRQSQLLGQAKTENFMSSYNIMQDQIAQAGSMDKAKQSIINQLSGQYGGGDKGRELAEQFVANQPGQISGFLDALKDRAKAAGTSIEGVLGESGITVEQAKAGLVSGDSDIATKVQEALQRVSVRETKKQDPITDIRDTLVRLNDTLGSLTDVLGFNMNSVMAKALFYTSNIASAAATIAGLVISWRSMMALQALVGGGGAAGAAGAGGGILTGLMGAFKWIMPFAKGAALLAGPLLGMGRAWSERSETGQGVVTSTVYGALTGSGKTGSMLSPMLGIEKDSAMDKTLGVAGAAASAALTGFMIGGPWGAAIGALVGGLTEVVKIATGGADILDMLGGAIGKVVDWGLAANKWLVSTGVSLLGMFNPIVALFPQVVRLFDLFVAYPGTLSAVGKTFVDMGVSCWNFVTGLGTTIGTWIRSLGASALTVFTPFSAMVAPALALYKVLSNIPDLFGALGTAISNVSSACLNFVTGIGSGITTWIGKTVDGVLEWFGTLWYRLVGGSIVPDLVEGIIAWFMKLPGMIFDALTTLGMNMLGAIGEFMLGIPGMVLGSLNELFSGIPGMLYETVTVGLKNALGGVVEYVTSLIPGAKSVVEGVKETNEQASSRIDKEGYSVTHGIGRMMGGIGSAVTGDWSGFGKTFSGMWETVAGTTARLAELVTGAEQKTEVSTALEGAFAEGQGREAMEGDLAVKFNQKTTEDVLKEKELPELATSMMTKEANNKQVLQYAGAAVERLQQNTQPGIISLGGMQEMQVMDPTIADILLGTQDIINAIYTSMTSQGAFAPDEAAEAIDLTLGTDTNRLTYAKSSGDAFGSTTKKLQDSNNVTEQQNKSIFDKISNIYNTTKDSISENFDSKESKLLYSELGGVYQNVKEKVLNVLGVKDTTKTETSTFQTGAFSPGEPREALDGTIATKMSELMYKDTVTQQEKDFLQKLIVEYGSTNDTTKLSTKLAAASEIINRENNREVVPLSAGAFAAKEPQEAMESGMFTTTNSNHVFDENNILKVKEPGSELAKCCNNISKMNYGDPINAGIFGNDQISDIGDVMNTISYNDLNHIVSSSISKQNNSPFVSPTGRGIFDPDNSNSVLDQAIDSKAKEIDPIMDNIRALTNKATNYNKSIIEKTVNVARSLFYGESASDAATSTDVSKSIDYGDISSSPIDYTEAMRGEVNTLASQMSMESRIEKERLTEKTSNSSANMDELTDYMVATHDHKMDLMVDLLQRVVDNTAAQSRGSTIIGASSDGTTPTNYSVGVESMRRENVKGRWDLAYSDFAPGTVMSEGQGNT